MTRALPIFVLSVVFCACSSDPGGADASSDVIPGDTSVDVSIATDVTASDTVTLDVPPGNDAGPNDAGADPLVPHQPAGATLCGHGTFTTGDAAMGCMSPSFVLDNMFLPDGGHASTPRDCSAITIASGGRWEVWCSGTSAYVWARFDGVTNTGSLTDCHGASLLWVDEGVWETGSGGGNGAHVGTYMSNGTSIIGTVPGTPQIAIYDVEVGITPGTMGSAKLFLLGNIQDTCMMGAPMPPTVLSGITVNWTAP